MSKNVLIAGGTGLIGNELGQLLQKKGYQVALLSRKSGTKNSFITYAWDVEKQYIDRKAIEQADYVINLAGAGIADEKWTITRKKHIIESRSQSTSLLLRTFKEIEKFPKAYISASAIGYYGSRGDEFLTENSAAGKGFLAESCVAWENAAQSIAITGTRTVIFRIGIVLSKKGGALPKMLMSVPFGISPYFGDGKQYYSWIHIKDICNMFLFAIEQDSLHGIFNAVAPNPITNKTLSEAIITASGHFALPVPTPGFALRMGMGEMSAIVLDSCRVSAQKIASKGFNFEFSEVLPALKDLMQ